MVTISHYICFSFGTDDTSCISTLCISRDKDKQSAIEGEPRETKGSSESAEKTPPSLGNNKHRNYGICECKGKQLDKKLYQVIETHKGWIGQNAFVNMGNQPMLAQFNIIAHNTYCYYDDYYLLLNCVLGLCLTFVCWTFQYAHTELMACVSSGLQNQPIVIIVFVWLILVV